MKTGFLMNIQPVCYSPPPPSPPPLTFIELLRGRSDYFFTKPTSTHHVFFFDSSKYAAHVLYILTTFLTPSTAHALVLPSFPWSSLKLAPAGPHYFSAHFCFIFADCNDRQ